MGCFVGVCGLLGFCILFVVCILLIVCGVDFLWAGAVVGFGSLACVVFAVLGGLTFRVGGFCCLVFDSLLTFGYFGWVVCF